MFRKPIVVFALAAVLALLFVGLAAFNPAPVSAGGGIDDYAYTCKVLGASSDVATVQVTATEKYSRGRQVRYRIFYSAKFDIPLTADYWERDGRLLSIRGTGSVRMLIQYPAPTWVSRAVTCSAWKDASTRWLWRAEGVNVTTSW